ncbi:MAG: V-type ATPase 116kDa subunit family protein [Candidatus Micrarchaeota archaeon]|nr:V-type ATPase 116kDa subunit family protein [Candidatus Micrarchaeota archaeon]
MFKSEPMQRIRAYCEKGSEAQVVEALYEFGAIHVTPAKHSFLKEHGQALDSFKDVSTALIQIRTAESIFGKVKINTKRTLTESSLESFTLPQLLKKYQNSNVGDVVQLNEESEKLFVEQGNLERKIEDYTPLALFESLDEKLARVKSVAFTLFQTNSAAKVLKEDFAKLQNTSTSVKQNGSATYCLVVFDKVQNEQVSKIIAKHASHVIPVPQLQNGGFRNEVEKLQAQLISVKQRIQEIKTQIATLKEEQGSAITSLRVALEIESKKAQLPFQFGATNTLIAVEGWVAKKNASNLETTLAKKVKNTYVEFIETIELAPTKLVNPRPLNSFEELVKFFSLPKSNELDPTALVAVSFPLFFGMIVGDIGYGLVALLLALFIKHKTKGDYFMQSFGTMLAVSSVSSIIFGVIFGEFFGFEHILGVVELHPLIHRVEEHGLAILMALTILFGMLHLAIGYAIGAWQAFKHGHSKHGYAKVSWLVLEFSLALFIAGNLKVSFLYFIEPIAQVIPPIITGPLVLLSVIGIAFFEGPTALFEIPGLLSNIFSYLRIMALGVAGVVIALILNKIPESISFATPVAIVTSILLLALYVFGHLAGIVLALFESMIQSMRLQYVEFFSKFFEGGGIQFNPLNPKKV